MWNKFWTDESGAVLTTELLMVTSVMVAGLATGLTKVRDAISGEMDDVAMSIGEMNQSFAYSGVRGPSGFSVGSDYQDARDPISHSSACVVQTDVR